MKLRFIIILLLTFFTSFAQEKATVTGKVTDKDLGGEPLAFANISVKGMSIATNTDETGNYTLKVPTGDVTIVFSFWATKAKKLN
jgi:hypothetical protein